MNQRKAFLFFGVMVLVWSIFWHGAIRTIAVRQAAKKGGDSPAASGILVNV